MPDQKILREKARAVVRNGKLPSAVCRLRAWEFERRPWKILLVFSVPGHPDWRWRIVDDDRKTVEDSSASFPTVAEALAEGRERRQRQVDS